MSDDPERKKSYAALYAAIGGEIRLWANPRGEWQMVATGDISEEARMLLKLLLIELGRIPIKQSDPASHE